MLFFLKDLGFFGLVLPFLIVAPIFAFFVRRKWRIAAARKQEILRRVVLASEEAARAELEAVNEYSTTAAQLPVQKPQCAVCYAPTTTRCARCKAVRYCSGKCQIIHWRQGHKDECYPPPTPTKIQLSSRVSDPDSKLTWQAEKSNNGHGANSQWNAKSLENLPGGPSLSNSSCISKHSLENKDEVRPPVNGTGAEFSVSSGSLDLPQSTTSEETILGASAGEEYGTSAAFISKVSIADETPINVLKTSADATDASMHSSLPSESPDHLASVKGVFSSSKLKQKALSGVAETVESDLSSSSSLKVDSTDGQTVVGPSMISHENLNVNRDSGGTQTTSPNDSSSSSSFGPVGHATLSESEAFLRFSFNLCGHPVVPSQNSNSMIFSSDNGRHSVSGDATRLCVDAPLKLPKDVSTSESLPASTALRPTFVAKGGAYSSERSSSAAKEKSNGPLAPNTSKSFAVGKERSNGILVSSSEVLPSVAKERENGLFASRSESSSTVAKDRSIDQLPKSRRLRSSTFGASADHPSSFGGHSSSSDLSKCNNVQKMPDNLPETASLGLNGGSSLKTSMRKVVQQFKASKLSKHYPLGFGSEIARKYCPKMLFPYDTFVKLYNCDKVELRPCGLINCGNSCYANAVLQCLAFTRPLSAYLLQGLHSRTCPKRDWCFTCEFENLILKAKEGRSPLSPIGILSQIKNIGSHLGHGREEDAHEFLRYAIDTMQSVCLKEAGANASDPLAEDTSLIQLIFGGYLRSKIKCMKCQGKSERHERMMDLTVEIHGDIGTLEEALRQFTATEILDGDNKYQCGRCKSYEKAKKKLTILEAPNILTIALKRFQTGKFGKLNKPVRFPEILNLAPYMSGTSDKSPVYRLYAVVVHLDVMNAAFSGHYVCYVKNIQGKWFKIDDSVVKQVDLDRVLSKSAYMLLYSRCSPRAPSSIRSAMSHEYASLGKKTKCAETIPSSQGEKNIHRGRCDPVPSDDPATSLRRSHNPYWLAPDALSNMESSPLDGRFLPVHKIPKTDSSSDNSSLLSCSDEGSCSTESTRDSTSTEECSEYIFGDSGHFSWNSPMRFSDDSDASSYSSGGLRQSPPSTSNGQVSGSLERRHSLFDFSYSSQDDGRLGRETSVESYNGDDGVATRWSQRSRIEGQRGPSSLLSADPTRQRRNLTYHRSSSSETDWEWVDASDVKLGVSLSSGERTSQAFY